MAEGGSRFRGLPLRLVSASVLIGLALLAVYQGPDAFSLLVVIAIALMAWELFNLHSKAIQLSLFFGCFTGIAAMSMLFMPTPWLVVMVALLLFIVAVGPLTGRVLVGGTLLAFLWAGFTLIVMATDKGNYTLLWIVGTVIAADVGAYFAGKLIGGPKIWPSVSPGKTWAGSLGGIAAALLFVLVLLTFVEPDYNLRTLLYHTAMMAIASQMGDFYESWLKRRQGVKDISNLIPGHGGVWDRFDGLIGACIYLTLAGYVTHIPNLDF